MKKSNRLFFLSFFLLMSAILSAQTQQGIVKTRGRMVNGMSQPGQGLQGATVQVKDRSAVVSGTNGKFSFPLRTNTYLVQSVKKQGYQLVDMEACRSYQYSKDPIYLVMETPEQIFDDLQKAQDNIRIQLSNLLKQKQEEIKKLNVSLEEKNRLLQQLYQEQSNNDRLINEMSKQYSMIDYDVLDDYYRQVSLYIENGELTKADSLLRTRGDIKKQLIEQLKEDEAIDELEEKLIKSKAVRDANKEEFARRCYSFFETKKMLHQNDSAFFYLEQRAKRDTANAEWQIQLGDFLKDYLSEYDKALSYYRRALNIYQTLHGDSSLQAALVMNFIGETYHCQGKHKEALDI